MQWKPSIHEEENGAGNDEWAVVDAVAVSYKNDSKSDAGMYEITTNGCRSLSIV